MQHAGKIKYIPLSHHYAGRAKLIHDSGTGYVILVLAGYILTCYTINVLIKVF